MMPMPVRQCPTWW